MRDPQDADARKRSLQVPSTEDLSVPHPKGALESRDKQPEWKVRILAGRGSYMP